MDTSTAPARASPRGRPPASREHLAGRLARWRDAVLRLPLIGVVLRAVRHYVLHQSANQAGSVAFSTLLAMFPLLILATAAAGVLAQPGDAPDLVARVLALAPPLVREALQPAVDQVMRQHRHALLAIGFVVTLWTASSGMQSIRTALNRAYGVRRGLSFWKARLKVTLFTVVVGGATIAAFGGVVVLPTLWQLLRSEVGVGPESAWLRATVRYGTAFVVLSTLYALVYAWLPDVRQRWRTVLPGALLGAALWVVAAALLSTTLRSAGKLALVYGGFTGLVATLVFLYASASTLIFGAEVNGVIARDRDRA